MRISNPFLSHPSIVTCLPFPCDHPSFLPLVFLAEIGELCKKNKTFFHVDAAQMVGKVPVNVDEMNIDLLSISGHKIYGPKGVGALYVRRRPRVRLEAIISGGGQERGLRSGTLPHPLVVGLGSACEIANKDMDKDSEWIKFLGDRLLHGLQSQVCSCVHLFTTIIEEISSSTCRKLTSTDAYTCSFVGVVNVISCFMLDFHLY